MCVCLCVCVCVHMNVGAQEVQRHQIPLELRLQALMSSPTWVLRAELVPKMSRICSEPVSRLCSSTVFLTKSGAH